MNFSEGLRNSLTKSDNSISVKRLFFSWVVCRFEWKLSNRIGTCTNFIWTSALWKFLCELFFACKLGKNSYDTCIHNNLWLTSGSTMTSKVFFCMPFHAFFHLCKQSVRICHEHISSRKVSNSDAEVISTLINKQIRMWWLRETSVAMGIFLISFPALWFWCRFERTHFCMSSLEQGFALM